MQSFSVLAALLWGGGSWVFGLLLLKGVVEPAATYWGSRLACKYLPQVFDAVDPIIGAIGFDLTGDDLKELVLNTILNLADEDDLELSEAQAQKLLERFRDLYDPFVAANKNVKRA